MVGWRGFFVGLAPATLGTRVGPCLAVVPDQGEESRRSWWLRQH
jgi:hypothetical protein